MVWGEFPSWGMKYDSLEGLATFIKEWVETVERDFNHPSIVLWCPLNEAWKDLNEPKKSRDVRYIDAVYSLTKIVDNTRPCVDVSGGFHGHQTDLYDFHCYEEYDKIKQYLNVLEREAKLDVPLLYDEKEKTLRYVKGLPVNVSEFGGIRFSKVATTAQTNTIINPVRGDSLDLMLSFSNITYSGVSVYLKDVNDTTKSVKITLKNEGTIKVYINDAYKAEFSGKFADYKATSLNMVYDGEKVRFGELASVAIEEYENGNEFLGFGETVTFRLGVEGVTGAGELALVKLNNQYMYDFDGDLNEAEVAVRKIAGERVLNDTVTLPVAFGYDVLTGYTNVTLQVKAPDGTTVQASDGTLLDGKASSTMSYTFTLTQYGMYTIAYSTMDGNGNALNYTYIIPCADAVW